MTVVTINDLEKKLKGIKVEGFIIQHANERIFEYVKNKKVQVKPTKVYSLTKSIISILIGILVDKGLIKNIHTPISEYFPELLTSNEPWKKDITVFHLLTMTSGLKVVEFQASKNWVKAILEQPNLYEPGSTFQYNSGDSHLLSAIVKKISGMPTATFAEKNLFGHLGIIKTTWVEDPQRIHGGGFSLSLNLEDMMKIGTLLLSNGNHLSKQIVSANWIEKSSTTYKQVESTENGIFGYGYQLWTYESTIGNNIDYYCASGLFGQYIFIVPKLEIVAVVKSQLQKHEQTLPRIYFEEFLRSL